MALLVLALVGGALALWQRPWVTADEPAPTGVVAEASGQLTGQLRAASTATSRAELVEAFGASGPGERFAREVWASLRALDASDVELRYVSGGDVADRADGTARVVAEVAWRAGRISGLRADVLHRSSVILRVQAQEDGTFAIVEAAPRSGSMPVWLIGEVTVRRDAGSVVVAIDGGDDRLPAPVASQMATKARRAVVRTLPAADGEVVLVSPRTQEQMARVVGQPADGVAQIAAVTTRLDVASASAEDAVIVLNPQVFATMDDRAAQVVLNHEATHQLTRAVGTRAETWVIEGFADYVALRDDTAPLSVSAGQILAKVRAGRLPERLPSAAAFDARDGELGAVYESSWLIFRMLAERHSAAEIVSFYESVLGGAEVAAALRDTFGLSVRQLTDQWRDYLTKSASTVS